MKIFKISKKNGKYRTIYAPNKEERFRLRVQSFEIEQAVRQEDPNGVKHGFVVGRSPVTNAMKHRGYKFTVSFDLSDFFDSVKPEMVPEEFRKSEFFPDGAARQGLPTSPALANLAAVKMDEEIINLSKGGRIKNLFVYTRYADDLTFSFNSEYLIDFLREKIPQIVEKHGFKINPQKTKVQSSVAGRRMITGVAVDKELHCPRFIKRKLRAALHQNRKAQVIGLSEWAKLKIPQKFAILKKENKVFTLSPEKVNNTKKEPAKEENNQVAVRKFNFKIDINKLEEEFY